MSPQKKARTQQPQLPDAQLHEELLSSDDDDDLVAPPPIDGAESEEGEGEEGEEEEGEEEEEEEEAVEQNERSARKRRRAVARRKGYRQLATKGGYSTGSTDASRDVVANILGLKEVVRACKWVPALPDAGAAYSQIETFAERLELSQEPLPQGPAMVFRASGEVFLRRIMNEAMQRTFDAGKTRVSVSTVVSVLRPLQAVLKHDFAAPIGLVRHAQRTLVGGEGKKSPALGTLDLDDAELSNERESIVPKQIHLCKSAAKALAQRKKERLAKKAGAPGAPGAPDAKQQQQQAAAADF